MILPSIQENDGLKELNPNHHTISNCGNVVDDLNT
ncbi:MAG: hypothetical protein RIR79_858 [Pseudomonadota bacterium]|jgi:hypothetical protein